MKSIVTKELGYISDMDITVLFECVDKEDGSPVSMELVAWCHGEVDEDEVEKYRGHLKAEYNYEDDIDEYKGFTIEVETINGQEYYVVDYYGDNQYFTSLDELKAFVDRQVDLIERN